MRKYYLIFLIILAHGNCLAQGFNHQWLIGNTVTIIDTNTTAKAARILFDATNADTIGETRKLAVWETQANISDANGNLLFASNGCWIMDASGDTMQNGGDLNPGSWADSYCSSTTGLPNIGGNLIIPFPGYSTRFILFHQIGNFSITFPYLNSPEIFYTVVDMNLNGGLGGVIVGQKNLIAFSDTLSWGLAACKHANGRDWWVTAIRDYSNTIFKLLVTPSGITSVTSQTLNMPPPSYGNAGQPCFSPDGTKFAYKNGLTNPAYHDVRILSFDRCTGMFDSLGYTIRNGEFGFGLSFSPNSRYLYYSSGGHIYQLDTDAPNIAASDTLVATFDGYCYPCPTCCTTFWLMYLAANGKIYITSGAGTIDLTYINSPDSSGNACDVQQHALRLPCYTIRAGLNHPNYYLGCDTTLGCTPCYTGIDELSPTDFKFRVYPNPATKEILNIGYLLPQSKGGWFEIYDVTGKVVFKYPLPPWSNEQSFKLPGLSNGVYNCVITSDNKRMSKKVAVIKQ
jgi:hypothetical protein